MIAVVIGIFNIEAFDVFVNRDCRFRRWWTNKLLLRRCGGRCADLKEKRIVGRMAMARRRVLRERDSRPTHCENCTDGEASVLVLGAIRVVTMRHITSILCDACRVALCRGTASY